MLSLVHLSGSQCNPDVKSFTDAMGRFRDARAPGICTCVDHCDCENNCTRSRRMASPKLIMPFFRLNVSIFCKENMQLESITSQKSNYGCMTLPLHCFPVCV